VSSAVDVVVRSAEAPTPSPGFRFRIIPQLDTYPSVVRFAQTIAGKLLLIALAAVGFYYNRADWKVYSAFLVATTFFPGNRRQIVFAGTILYSIHSARSAYFGQFPAHGFLSGAQGFKLQLLFIAVSFALGWVLFSLASRYRRSFVGKRPITVLLLFFFVCLIATSCLPMSTEVREILFLLLTVFSGYMWYIGYSLLDLKSMTPEPFWRQASSFRPLWSIFPTPLGKGITYWRRIEATDAEQLAITQLKGLKLITWAAVLRVIFVPIQDFFYGTLSIPSYQELLARTRYGIAFHWYQGWASLLASFLLDLLSLSIVGHILISLFRLAGFRALRDTYRPLQSRTVAEFWNRYYYYFKELLVEFFFFPTYMRYFKRWKRFRMVAATFAAAFFGNLIFHFARDLFYVRELGLWKAITGLQVYAFFCLVLATAISISQLRDRPERPPRGWLRDQLWPMLCVAGFYCVLHTFDTQNRTIGIGVYFRFLGHIFNFFT